MRGLTFGAITVDALSDGEIGLPLENMFPGVDPELFRVHGGITDEGATLAPLTTFVVRAAGRLILVDTGMGPDLGPLARFGFSGTVGLLPAALANAGIVSDAVDDVVFTHLHSDHTGWNTVLRDGSTQPMFPKARYIVTRIEWEHRVRTAGRESAERSLDPIELSGQLTLVDDGHEVAPGVSLLATPGHTPGHTSVLIMGSSGEGGIITGDAAHHPAELENPELTPAFDYDPAQSARSRLALVERAEAQGLIVMGGHFPAPTAGTIVRVEQKRQWKWLGA